MSKIPNKLIKDRTGNKYNKWTFIEFSHVNKHGEAVWLCKCECGNEVKCVGANVSGGHSKQCMDCARKPKTYKNKISKVYWRTILRNAEKRDKDVLITRKQAEEKFLTQKGKCALTGLTIYPPKNGTEMCDRSFTASLDRKDSEKGYTLNNIQWVHKHINRMKNIFEEEYFIKMCELVASNIKTKKR